MSRRRHLAPRRRLALLFVAMLLLVGTVFTRYLGEDLQPRLELAPARTVVATPAPPLQLPHGIQVAVASPQLGPVPLTWSPHEHPVPIASLAKLMTALLVVHAHPLLPGRSGPTLVVTPGLVVTTDVDEVEDQSTIPVHAGERLTERQLLEALLVRSANNVATLLADWVSGSEPRFVAAMNAAARRLGLASTHFADASGFNRATVSTAHDVAVLSALVLANPTLAGIVRLHAMVVPGQGLVPNIIPQIGTGDVIGVKSGFTLWSGGCAAVAVRPSLGEPAMVGVVLGEQGYLSLARAAAEAQSLAGEAERRLRLVTLLSKGAIVGNLQAPWRTRPVALVAESTLRAWLWPGTSVRLRPEEVRLPVHPVRGARIGFLSVAGGGIAARVPVLLRESLTPPGISWRIAHAL